MVALSHPNLRPDAGAKEIRRHSQQSIDLINLQTNTLETRAVADVIDNTDPALAYLVSEDQGDYIQPLFSDPRLVAPERLVLTFDNLLKKTDFVPMMKSMLARLEQAYAFPVDIEFTADIRGDSKIRVHLLQCRPQSLFESHDQVVIPYVPIADQLFTANRLVPQGSVSGIRYIVYIDPEKYGLADRVVKAQIARVVSRLNKRLEKETFILMGPGRWGSTNIDLGVQVSYADINNTRVLVEVALPRGEGTPEVSYGTHFFQDLVEARIFPLPLFPADPSTVFNREFFLNAQNVLAALLPEDESSAPYVHVIDVPASSSGRHLEIVMNEEKSEALAYLK
jgi:hypothetical protein